MDQKYSVEVPDLGIQISTGSIAKQANGSVTISMGETNLLVTATAAGALRDGQDFFPLTVDYRETFSAAGKIPGGYFKREGRPNEKEILTSRLCDRPLRPLFPKGFMNEVQVIGLLLSADMVNDPDILMVNGASAALLISDIPWNGPIGGVRIGEIDGKFVVNPTHEQMLDSTLDLVYVGNEREMMMIEGSAEQCPEDRFIEALEFAQVQIQKIISAQRELAKICGKQKREFPLVVCKPEIMQMCSEYVGGRLLEAVFQDSKLKRQADVDALMQETAEFVKGKIGEEEFDMAQIKMAFEELQEKVYRDNILDAGKRCDGRTYMDLRPISAKQDSFPACTAARCSPAEKHRPWCLRPSARRETARSSTGSPAELNKSLSYCTTTSRPTPSAKPDASAARAAAKSATARSLSARCFPCFRRKTNSRTRYAWCLK